MLGLGDYLLGVAAMVAALGALALGAARLRRRLLPGWTGMPAWLAEAVLLLGLLIVVAELVGAVGLLDRAPLTAACVAVGLGLRRLLSAAAPSSASTPPAPAVGTWAVPVALAISALLLVQWSIGTADALGAGMTGYDSAWYHMPFAAHFSQTGSTVDFAFVSPRYLSWFYPQNSELLHGIGIVFTERDLLSPLLNLAWLGGCLAAAWSIGRPYGLGAWTLAAVAIPLSAGLMADQAGEARNDTLALFFLLAAAAILVNAASARRRGGLGAGPLAVAGLAAGLAAGTKLSFAAPAAALLAGALLFGVRAERRRSLLPLAAPFLAGCGFWYLRNLVSAGNPVPWFDEVGPLQLPGPDQGLGGRPQHPVLDYIGDGQGWGDWLEPGLSNRLGELWPLLLAAAVIAIGVCLARDEPALGPLGLAAAAGIGVYLIEGTAAEGPAGMPLGFASSLRHLLPAFALGLILVPLLFARGSARARAAVAALLAGLLVAAVASGEPWPGPYVAVAVAGVAIVLALAALRGRFPPPRRPVPARRLVAAASVAVTVLLLAGGWALQRSYLRDRYTGNDFRSPGLDAAFAWAAHVQGQRIATTLSLSYPLYGRDLSNRVDFLGRRRGQAGFTAIHRCRPWLQALEASEYRFVVTVAGTTSSRGAGCLARDPAAHTVLRRDRIVVIRLGA